MTDYYKILNINSNATREDIKKSYKNHINRFIGLPFLTNKMIIEIKEFKTAYYILYNNERRQLYDNRLKPKNTLFQKSEVNDDFLENTKINDRIFGNIFN